MRSSQPIIFARVITMAVILIGAGISQSCTRGSYASRTSAQNLHSVKLSWNPGIPASKLERDKIVGYVVYRSTRVHDLNAAPIETTADAGTTYVDRNVQAGTVYYYVTRARNARGMLSGPSNEIRVEVPR